eukprot:gb/GFBE01010210.1/.p1 GENE.gb/GFBE01010210.1/~~gb/GFBE01010210.1/.p1  ORF type:complete len:225 (+),score=24.49 gb/GFBE01010210.1/:1-675(+)
MAEGGNCTLPLLGSQPRSSTSEPSSSSSARPAGRQRPRAERPGLLETPMSPSQAASSSREGMSRRAASKEVPTSPPGKTSSRSVSKESASGPRRSLTESTDQRSRSKEAPPNPNSRSRRSYSKESVDFTSLGSTVPPMPSALSSRRSLDSGRRSCGQRLSVTFQLPQVEQAGSPLPPVPPPKPQMAQDHDSPNSRAEELSLELDNMFQTMPMPVDDGAMLGILG